MIKGKLWLLTGLLMIALTACQTDSAEEDLRQATLSGTATLGDLVWDDFHPNGVLEPGEPGLPGVHVKLYLPGGDNTCGTGDDFFIMARSTDAQGKYQFTGLATGSYCLEFVPPGDFVFSAKDQGGDDTLDSDADPDTGFTDLITLSADEVDNTVDAAVHPPKTCIGDFVWNDLDQDGIQDPNEPGIEGVEVALVNPGPDGICGTGDDSVISTTTTDADGFYAFNNLDGGDYCVQFTRPDGFTPSPQNQGGDDAVDSNPDPDTGITDVISVENGETEITIDAGYYQGQPPQLAELGDFVFNDLDQDGIQDANEPGLSGLNVMLLDPGDDTCDDGDTVLRNTTTNSNGRYLFAGLQPGDYCVMFNAPSGFVFSPANQGNDDNNDSDASPGNGKSQVVTLSSGELDLSVDAGVYQPDPNRGRIGDRVFNDTNQNGIQNAGEPGVPGVVVRLKDCNDNVLRTTVTDNDGNYLFDNLAAGCYVVDVLPNGFTFSPQNQGDDDTRDSDVDPDTGETGQINLDPGEEDLTNDAGVFDTQPDSASLGDRVFNDTNQNGLQDPGEPGLAGLEVMLLDPGDDTCEDGDTVLDSTTTNSSGVYSFDDLASGDYCVMFNLPGGFVFSPANQGNDDSDDSDADPSNGKSQVVTLAPGENNDTVDAGGYQAPTDLGSIGDTVFIDTNNNATQDAGEPGIPGVRLQLTTPGADNVCDTSDDPLLATDTTDANGNYLFDNLEADTYCVDVVSATLPSGLSITTNNDPERVGLGAGQDFLDADFGYRPNNPAIDIEKTPDNQTVNAGDTVTFTITVTNTGNVPLDPVTVNDPLAPNCNRALGNTLGQNLSADGASAVAPAVVAPGESTTYTCTLENVTSSFTNVATVTGTAPNGQTVTDEDDANVTVTQPVCSLDVNVTATPTDIIPRPVPSCDTLEDKPDTITWRFDGGSEPLGQCAGSTLPNATNAKGKRHEDFECSGSVDPNQALTVTPDKGGSVSVSPGGEFTLDLKASKELQLSNGGGTQNLEIHTSCSQPIAAGFTAGALTIVALDGQRASEQDATFTYEVTNNGSPVNDISLTDSFGTVEDDFDLAAGESRTFTRTQNITSTTTNRILVSGVTPDGQTCEAQGEGTVTVSPPPRTCEDGDPTALVFEYTGESCAASNNTQGSKFECSGSPGAGTVSISLADDADDFILSTNSLSVGDTVRISSSEGPDKDLKSSTELNVGSQFLDIHTSCSAPLNVGDQFGSLILREFIPEND